MPNPIVEFVWQEPSSEYVIIAVSDSGAKKRNHLKPSSFGSIFPTVPRQRSNSTLPEQREYSNARVGGRVGVLKFRVNRHKTYSLNIEPGVQKRTILYSLYSMTKTNNAAKIPLTVQLLKGKKNSHSANCQISSFKVFHLGQTRVYCC